MSLGSPGSGRRRRTDRGVRGLAGLVGLILLALLAAPDLARAAPDLGQGAGHPRDLGRLSRSGAEPTMRMDRAAASDTATRLRHVKVEWKGSTRRRNTHHSVAVPGIGTLSLTCRTDDTEISLKAYDGERETQMWMAKYQDKSYGPSVAVKTVRIYKYASASDPGHGGTGNPQNEGLNLGKGKNGVENYEKGFAHGIISQRPGRNVAVGDAELPPVTTFDVNWYWNGFDYPARYRYCKIDMMLETKFSHPLGLDWHGDDDAVGHDFEQVHVPSLGYVQLRCETGRDGNQLISLVPAAPRMKLYTETIQGEGRVDDQVQTRNRVVDRDTGKIGPVPLPQNGMMRLFFSRGKVTYPYLLSSFVLPNNAAHPALNVCEIAMGASPR